MRFVCSVTDYVGDGDTDQRESLHDVDLSSGHKFRQNATCLSLDKNSSADGVSIRCSPKRLELASISHCSSAHNPFVVGSLELGENPSSHRLTDTSENFC